MEVSKVCDIGLHWQCAGCACTCHQLVKLNRRGVEYYRKPRVRKSTFYKPTTRHPQYNGSINTGFWLVNGYVALCKDRKNFPILEHRLVMERVLGRPLSSKESIHHIDENKQNNDPANLIVMRNGRHTGLHNSTGPLRGHAKRKVK